MKLTILPVMAVFSGCMVLSAAQAQSPDASALISFPNLGYQPTVIQQDSVIPQAAHTFTNHSSLQLMRPTEVKEAIEDCLWLNVSNYTISYACFPLKK